MAERVVIGRVITVSEEYFTVTVEVTREESGEIVLWETTMEEGRMAKTKTVALGWMDAERVGGFLVRAAKETRV